MITVNHTATGDRSMSSELRRCSNCGNTFKRSLNDSVTSCATFQHTTGPLTLFKSLATNITGDWSLSTTHLPNAYMPSRVNDSWAGNGSLLGKGFFLLASHVAWDSTSRCLSQSHPFRLRVNGLTFPMLDYASRGHVYVQLWAHPSIPYADSVLIVFSSSHPASVSVFPVLVGNHCKVRFTSLHFIC